MGVGMGLLFASCTVVIPTFFLRLCSFVVRMRRFARQYWHALAAGVAPCSTTPGDAPTPPTKTLQHQNEQLRRQLDDAQRQLQQLMTERDTEMERMLTEFIKSKITKYADAAFSAHTEWRLTFKAPYGIVGDSFHKGIEKICTFLVAHEKMPAGSGDGTKEGHLQAIPIVSPPRHGKSLLLDEVACRMRERYVCVKISMNGVEGEAHDHEKNETGLCLRILHRLTRTDVSGCPFYYFVQTELAWFKSEYCLTWTVLYRLLQTHARFNPGNLPFLFLVDEVTSAKDRNALGKALKAIFINQNRVIVSGFSSTEITAFFSASGIPLDPKLMVQLEPCSKGETTRLGQRIRSLCKYKCVVFDELRWQTSKAYPGLVGFWLEALVRDLGPDVRAPFEEKIKSDLLAATSALEALMRDFIIRSTQDKPQSFTPEAQKLISDANLQLPAPTDGRPAFCFAPVYRAILFNNQVPREFIAEQAFKAILAAARRGAVGQGNEGVPFEKFAAHVMLARLEALRRNTTQSNLRDFFGPHAKVWTVTSETGPTTGPTTLLVTLTKSQELRPFLGEALYDAFPADLPQEFTFSSQRTVQTNRCITQHDVLLLHGLMPSAPRTKILEILAGDASPVQVKTAQNFADTLLRDSDVTFRFAPGGVTLAALGDAIFTSLGYVGADDAYRAAMTTVPPGATGAGDADQNFDTEVTAKTTQAGDLARAVDIVVPSKLVIRSVDPGILSGYVFAKSGESDCVQHRDFDAGLSSKAQNFADALSSGCVVVPSKPNFPAVDVWASCDLSRVAESDSNGRAAFAVQIKDRRGMNNKEWNDVFKQLLTECCVPPQVKPDARSNVHQPPNFYSVTTNFRLRVVVMASRTDTDFRFVDAPAAGMPL